MVFPPIQLAFLLLITPQTFVNPISINHQDQPKADHNDNQQCTAAEMASLRTIGRVVTLPQQRMNAGFSAHRLSIDALPRIDPLLNVDWFSMSQPTFPPHPHAGFCAVTYIFPESPQGFMNRDSAGMSNEIKPGELHWTTAGSGVVHEEVPIKAGIPGIGLQIFVNLPSSLKETPPRAQHLSLQDIHEVPVPGGGRVRVLAGDFGGKASPLELVYPFSLLDVRLPPGATFSHDLADTWNVAALVISGAVHVGGEVLRGEQAAELVGGRVVVVEGAGSEGVESQVVLLSGPPTGEAPVWRGPFCGANMEQVARWMRAYQEGRMGSLKPSF